MSIVKLHKLKQKYVLYKLLHKYRQQDSIARFLSFRSDSRNIIPEYIYYSLINWWGRNDKVLNYLLLDYIFKAGYNAMPQIKAIIDDLPVQRISTMVKHLKEPYSEALWAELTSHSGLHKLTWKKQFPLTDKHGTKTLYNIILSNYL